MPEITMHSLPSSLRVVPAETTLLRAKKVADGLGISRVTDITRLDKIGVPVFSSVRPAAVADSLCVNAGKGVRTIDAQVGAYMEAIEYAYAEPGRSTIEIVLKTPRDVLDGDSRPTAILDFCPIAQSQFDLSAPLACIEARDIIGGTTTFIPAELVLLPYVGHPGTGNFGSHSNGLASGNSGSEAVLHGLLEVVERDIRSFEHLFPQSFAVRLESLPPVAREIVTMIEEAGLKFALRFLQNEFEVPCFGAIIFDSSASGPLYLNSGYGCHLHRDIAAIRAITEAIQSRLSWIHGGRDDLVDPYKEAAKVPASDLARGAMDQFAIYSRRGGLVDYGSVPDCGVHTSDIDKTIDALLEILLRRDVQHVCCVDLAKGEQLIHVVRVTVPRLEYLDRGSHRVGPRLHARIRNRTA